MGDEIEPCPLCGSKTINFGARPSILTEVNGMKWVARGVCVMCLGRGPAGYADSIDAAEAKARARWNARAERTCRMNRVLLFDEEGVEGIECGECGWIDACAWDDAAPGHCPGCGAKVEEEGL